VEHGVIDGSTSAAPGAVDLSSLSPAKRALIEKRLRDQRDRAALSSAPIIGPRPSDEQPTLSFAMRRLFVLDQALPDLTAYNVVQVLRLTGQLDRPALQKALQEVLARHEILRTAMALTASGEDVRIVPPGRFELDVVDLTQATAAWRSTRRPDAALDPAEARAVIDAAARERFDLGAGQLLRATLVRLADREHLLVLATHHIASDGVSKQIITAELGRLYRAFHRGEESPLPPVALHYLDYAAWEATHAQTAGREQVQWWQGYLRGAPELTALPLDRPRSLGASTAGAKYTTRLDAALVAELRGSARAQRATLFMVLLAAFATVLDRFAGQGEVVIGSPTSGRHHQELRDVVGLFLNTLPIRVDTSGDPGFAELVDRVRTAAAAAYSHQDTPFEQIVDVVRPTREPSVNPLFQTMFTLKEGTSPLPELDGLTVTAVGFDGGWTKFDIGLTCYETPSGELGMLWQYSTALFDESTIATMARLTATVLREASAEPRLPLSRLDLTGDAERARQEGWNATGVSYPDALLHELVTAQARRTPEARAVGDDTGWITYRELDERSNRLAHHLIQLGVRPDSRVAVCLPRSVALEIALLATLKAGGCYVPLDAGYPKDRLAYMLADSEPAAILTDASSRDRLPEHPVTIDVDSLAAVLASYPAGEPDVALEPSNLAYVIYTSGTTGRPKGVQIEHRGIVNRLLWMQDEYRLDPADVVLQKTPISFDVSVWELFWPMITGAGLFMARPDGHRDPGYLAAVIASESVTVTHFVPSMLDAFLSDGVAPSCGGLRLVVTSGEALPDALKEEFFRQLPGCELHNLYGPTEASVDVTYDRCRPGQNNRVTIGRPISNTQTWVLDEHGRPCPILVPGELHLGGVGLSRGYLNKPDLTAERFTDSELGRLYRTGDRARWLPDGRLQFLGRLDDQVKLRGLRIELSEISSVLAQDPSVGQAVCLLRGTTAADQRLIAFVVPAPGAAPDVVALRDQARRALPDYMVPSTIAVVDDIPLTPSGKLDRATLLAGAPDVTASSVQEFIAPSGDTQIKIEQIWRDELGLTGPISVNANFFDLGGHSLMALTLFRRMERAFRVKLSLSVLFQQVTVASLAEVIDAERRRTEAWDSLVPLRTTGYKRPLFFMPELRGDVLTYRAMLEMLAPDRPVYGVQAPGLDGRIHPKTTIEDLAAECVECIRRVQPAGPYNVAGYCFGGVVAYEVARQLSDAGESIAFVGLIDAVPPRVRSRAELENAQALTRAPRTSRRTLRDARDRLRGEISRHLFRLQYLGTRLFMAMGRRIPRPLFNVMQVNREALKRYSAPRTPLNVTVFGAAAPEGTRRANTIVDRWATVTSGKVELEMIYSPEIDHYRIIRDEAGLTAEAINRALIGHS
jgi:amino acid adenylation domain-containing protein